MRWCVLSFFILTTGCLGRFKGVTSPSGGDTQTVPVGWTGAALDAAPTHLYHLTAEQYQRALVSLFSLHDADVAALVLPTDQTIAPSELLVDRLSSYAGTIASLGAHTAFVPCDLTSDGSAACADQFITKLGLRAFRHPVTDEERATLTTLYTSLRPQFSFSDTIAKLVEAMMQMPSFFYVLEQGAPQAGLPDGLYQLTPYEMATRLALTLWRSIPDEALLAAAADGRLGSLDGIRDQATRMLADPQSNQSIIEFLDELFEINGTAKHLSVTTAIKDPTVYPSDNPALRVSMMADIHQRFVKLLQPDGTLGDLFTSNQAYVDGPLAQLYGVSPPASGTGWVDLPASKYAGITTSAAFITVFSSPTEANPIRAGSVIRRQLFCQVFPPPPPAANCVTIASGSQTVNGQEVHVAVRDQVILRTSDAQCAGCHQILNPAGFPLLHYDALGRWLDAEPGVDLEGHPYTVPIDATGDLVSSDVAGTFDGAVALGAKLAQSRNVKDCVTSKYLQSTFGRAVSDHETDSLKFVQDQFAASGKLVDLLVAFVQSPMFRYLRKGA